MLYRLLADMVVIFHFLFIVFALLGGLLFYWRRVLVLVHLPAAIWIALIELNHWQCPLTPLENSLRVAGHGAGYPGGFVEHYIIPVIYPPGLTADTQLVLGAVAILINVIVYSVVLRSWLIRKH